MKIELNINIFQIVFLSFCTVCCNTSKHSFCGEFYSKDDSYYKEGKTDTLNLDDTQVNRLVLGCNGEIVNYVPKEVNNFRNLKELVLSRTDISSIPCDLKIKSSIETLEMNMMPLKQIDCCIEDFIELKTLRLSFNSIDTLPDCICKLKKLEELFLTDCGIKYVPECIGNMPSLGLVALDYIKFSDKDGIVIDSSKVCAIPNEQKHRLRRDFPHIKFIFGDEDE